ncbi:cation diffusion facilitator family transporter [Paenibacillus validus]|uniref:Cation diffusion facilitator family transporter n=1 Tax=Paenibacillus validus TaxID=44253 RepID=A0A7X3CUQ9_9BACL|nr:MULTISPECIES: cation diffusion facilitator family transporter [Paenibacillus]MED4603008.1 cation diffusion facilitator family transporter [Paenibacillus validus]MED4608257.1 cation diffusion facilitator family transporter [Paenibacillus validus]MUG73762.1 cation diffusion facilitator family transporter [Paenibacillus validus]
MDSYDSLKEGEKGAWLSIVAYVFLSAFKITIGYMTGSEALAADGINNTTDIVVSLAVLIGLRISRKPPDRDHPYGHKRAETIASLIASFIMAAAGLQVVLQAGRSFFADERTAPDMLAAWVALACAAVMWGVYVYNYRLAKRIENQSLMAAAQDNRSDALVSIGAAVGIIGSRLGFPVLDAVAALIVGLIILKTAWEVFSHASHTLTDGFDDQRLKVFKQTVKTTPGVKRIKDIRARIHGNSVLLDVVVEVSAELSVGESHDISDEIERRMLREHRVNNVHVHIEPFEEQEKNGNQPYR